MASSKNESSSLEHAILSILRKSAASPNEEVSRKKLLKKLQKKIEGVVTKQILDDLLVKMCGSGKVICVKGKGKHAKYIIAAEESSSSSEDGHSSDDSESEDEKINQDTDDIDMLPFAERMRRNRQAAAEKNGNSDEKKVAANKKTEDIDDEIERLEAELNDSVGVDSESDDDESARDGDTSMGALSEEREESRIISLSKVAEDRIPALPKSYLPLPQCKRTLKIDLEMNGDDDSSDRKKRKRDDQTTQPGDGLKAAVREVLGGYVARSSERLPFYCRVCAKQMSNEEDFRDHKKTEFHRVAVREEQKASYCRLCRKQFTSPVQLKEHLNARPHREKLAAVKAKQRGGTWTKSNDGKRQTHALASRRQWC